MFLLLSKVCEDTDLRKIGKVCKDIDLGTWDYKSLFRLFGIANPEQRQRPITFLIFSILIFLLSNCAQQMPPTGGKKDEIAPKLVKSTPSNKQLNYKNQQIELLFDEYIVLENIQQKLSITPDAGEYDVKTLPTGLRLKFKKTLDSATTYSLSFGDAVKDFSEKNPAKNLRLVFSTGNHLDSASVGGTVKDLLTNKPVFDALVGIYPNSDTLNLEKMKPTYYTRTDSAGRFSLENIHANTYKIVAIADGNRSMTYNQRSEKIGYLIDSLAMTPSTQFSDVSLNLFYADYSPQKVKSTQPGAFFYKILYEKGIEDFKVFFTQKTDSIPYFRSAVNELTFFNTKNSKDTLLARISIQDSLGRTFEHSPKIKFREARLTGRNADKKEPFVMTTNVGEGDEIRPKESTLTFTFNKPVSVSNLDQIQLFSDSTKNEKIEPSNFVWKNHRTELRLKQSYSAKEELKLVLPKNTFFSVEGDTILAKTLKIKSMDEENYGIIQGEVRSVKSKFIVQLLDEKGEIVDNTSKTPFEFVFVKPNNYQIRVILDKNNNGRWDNGNFKTKIMPETIVFYPEVIKVKKNFIVADINLQINDK